MDDCPENVLKRLCCTCLSVDRKLFQLYKVPDGVNNLYLLLSCDSEAYREGFYKDTASLLVCWECRALMLRVGRFRAQACAAQRALTSIADGRVDTNTQRTCLSRLTHYHKSQYDQMVTSEETTEEVADNFIDCGPVDDIIKSEDDVDDIPLSELNQSYSDNEKTNTLSALKDTDIEEPVLSVTKTKKPFKRKKSKIKAKENSHSEDINKKYYTTTVMSEREMFESMENRKLASNFADAPYKCEFCIAGFKTQFALDGHNFVEHTVKPEHTACDLCHTYVPTSSLANHRSSHYLSYGCQFCDLISYTERDMLAHLKSGHAMRNIAVTVTRKKGERKTPQVMKPGSKPRRNPAMRDQRTPFGYMCPECNKYFDNKNKRWKHVQRCHREGFRCAACGKRFAFKNNLTRHLQVHHSPPPREPCPTCHKQVRSDLMRVHALTHAPRAAFQCAACEKTFASRASYEHHLKYTQAHAAVDVLKYKCSLCDKGYRSRGELRDHVNYQHMGRTQHKCPICGKALATPRCITRHVRRAHDGVKESPRDKICQQCGKAFRDKKGLREHEFIHTGERPLSCEICGCTFRQSASLYTHKKRVHKIYPSRKNVQLLDASEPAASVALSAQPT